jgi:tripartite ATP-independent transporter DctM subunit
MTALLLVLGFIALLLLGAPIAIALALPAIVYTLLPGVGIPPVMAAHTMTYSLDSFPLLAVPLFILVGALMNQTGITVRLFDVAQTLVSHWRGGLCHVNVLASLVFSGSSGAALADVAGLGKMEIQAMRRAGYEPGFACAVTLASATIGPMFPPSIPLVIFATVAEASPIRMLLAGVVPALLTTAALMATIALLARRRGFDADEERASWRRIRASVTSALPALLTPVILMGGMLAGVFTATEAAAVTVVYILLISAFVYRVLTWQSFAAATRETVRTTCVVMVMVAAASLFTRALTLERLPQSGAALLLSVSSEPLVLLLLVNVVLLIAGMFLESISAIVLLTPVLAPPLVQAGVDPVHLGVVVVYNLMIGLLTPPLGMSLFVVSDVGAVPVEQVLRELAVFFVPLLGMIAILTMFPQLSLWVPSLVLGE